MFYGLSAYWGASSKMSYHSALDAVKMCEESLDFTGVSIVPSRTLMMSGVLARMLKSCDPQSEQKARSKPSW